MSKILLEGCEHVLDDLEFLNDGGEGEVFKLPNQRAVKVYFEKLRTDDRSRKVLALCDKASMMSERGLDTTGHVLPTEPAVQAESGQTAGFSMKLVSGGERLEKYFYDPNDGAFPEVNGRRITDAEALSICMDLFWVLFRVHRLRMILGDVNPGNVLVDSKLKPHLIDLDSAAFDEFDSPMHSANYVDPQAIANGIKLSGAPHYSPESDVYSFTCMCYEVFVGLHPYFARSNPPRDLPRNAALGHTLLKAYAQGSLNGFAPENKTLFDMTLKRLHLLKTAHGELGVRLHDHFISTFVRGDRSNPVEGMVSRYTLTGAERIVDMLRQTRERQPGRVQLPARARVAVRQAPPSGRPYFEKDPDSFIGYLRAFGFKYEDLVQA